MRLFFAILLPEDVLDRIAVVQNDLRAAAGDGGIRWTNREQFHYTVKFLGETSVPRAETALNEARSVARQQTPFTLNLRGTGGFPNNQRPSVLWLGAEEGAEEMVELAKNLESALRRIDFPRDNRPMKPHLTLARIKSYRGEIGAARALKNLNTDEIACTQIDGFWLMQSILKPTGPEYSVIDKLTFIK